MKLFKKVYLLLLHQKVDRLEFLEILEALWYWIEVIDRDFYFKILQFLRVVFVFLIYIQSAFCCYFTFCKIKWKQQNRLFFAKSCFGILDFFIYVFNTHEKNLFLEAMSYIIFVFYIIKFYMFVCKQQKFDIYKIQKSFKITFLNLKFATSVINMYFKEIGSI